MNYNKLAMFLSFVLAVPALLFGVLAISTPRRFVLAHAQPRAPLSDRCRECVALLTPNVCLDDGHCTKGETMHYTQPIDLPERQVIALEDIARSLRKRPTQCPPVKGATAEGSAISPSNR